MTPDTDAGGERVSEAVVIRHWLGVERAKTGDGPLNGLTTRDALDELLTRKPGAASFLWRARPVEWSRMTLSQAEFERLRLVGGPDKLLWRALAPDGGVMTAAARIATGDPDALAAATGVDVERIVEFVSALENGTELEALVLTKRRGDGSPRIADGNHRAVGVGLHLLQTGEYRPVPAYLGVGANPVLRPIRQRVRGVLARLRSSGPRW